MSAQRLAVRSLRVIGVSDTIETHHTVQCPRRKLATAFERCCGCTHMKSIDVDEDGKHGAVECLSAAAESSAPRGRVDVAEAAIREHVTDLMGIDTTCVRGNVRVDTVDDLLTGSKLRALPVVDDGQRLIGIVSKTDLLRAGGRRTTKTVADIMTPLVHGLPEDAPIAYAISLMAFEGLHEVPVVDMEARVIGMITSTDALRWVARALGYVAPGTSPPTSAR